MLVTKIRKQGGAAVVTLPAEVLRQMEVGVGENLSIVVAHHTVTMRVTRGERQRYTLYELLAGVTTEDTQNIADDTAWARDGDAVGRELI
jgi:antitoxin ChpS